ncbi:MAG TPA: PIG-L family deacetylase [Planctomycetaceae bacterium]|nr:PIG-L family deacetylase [Planctomycetaceae bacterium]
MTVDASQLHVLAIHAHPDDIEFQCAGTLRRLRKLGCRISVATMTPGDCGSAEYDAQAIAAIRRDEARRAAVILEAECSCLEFRDLSIVFDNDSRRRMTEFLRKTAPNIILTAPPIDYMHDHEITSALVRDACFNASVPNYRTCQWDPAPATQKIPWLYFVDPVEGTDHFGNRISPDFVVDISEEMQPSWTLWPAIPASGNGCGDSMGWTNTWKPVSAGVVSAGRKLGCSTAKDSASIRAILIRPATFSASCCT